MSGKANGFVAADAPCSLHELIEETLHITCADGLMPTVRRLCFGARWAVVELSDGRAGRAFTFNGQHAVYGALDFEYMRSLQSLTGVYADDAVAQLLDEHVYGAVVGAADDAAYRSLRRSVALAVANALSCEVNAPEALAERGFVVSDSSDRSFFRPDDAVVLVGAGMLLREAAAMCASLDVVDLRPRAALQSVLLDADGVRTGPGTVRFHDVENTGALVAQADVVGITGCALENDSLFDIAEAAPSDDDVDPVIKDEAKRRGLIEATDLVKDKFGESAVRFGRELRGEGNTTGSASKNPADYK